MRVRTIGVMELHSSTLRSLIADVYQNPAHLEHGRTPPSVVVIMSPCI